ncbi:beta strand repeat-containing protein [Inquilinus sp.]|jgi:Ca2+-binding RTX toxin-like protein|uniref:beta strand repeat-containing protein n=1 Tax=Inquilinus sp. TaxID=1932117 RepID=UPI003784CDB3
MAVVIVGTNGDDVLPGTGFNDTISGLDGNDYLGGGGGVNTLLGGAGNDILDNKLGEVSSLLEGGSGADQIMGGGFRCFDTATYAHSSAGVTVDLLVSQVGSGGDAEGDTLTDIDGLIGSAFDDVLSNNSVNRSELNGGAGSDILKVGSNGGRLQGGTGADTLIGYSASVFTAAIYSDSASGVTVNLATGTGSGGDAEGDVLQNITAVTGSGHDDLLIGSSANDFLLGGGGDDVLRGGAGGDVLDGGDGEDIADYSQAAARITADLVSTVGTLGEANGDNYRGIEDLRGSAFNDVLSGDAGANVLEGGAGADTLNGRGGIDTVSYEHSAAGVTVGLTTGAAVGGDAQGDILAGFENLRGSAFADTLAGDTGNNTLEGGAGADALYGGAGTDTASYAHSAMGVFIDLGYGTVTGGDAAGDTLVSIENLIGSAFNDVLAAGGVGLGTSLSGGAGNDILQGGSKADIFDGGAGFDQVLYNNAYGVTVNLQLGIGLSGDAKDDTLIGIEGVTGSRAADHLIGSDADNVLYGRDRDDILAGGAGADILSGDGGADQLDGGSGIDTAYYASGMAGVQVDLGAHTASGGDAAGDTLTGIEQLMGSEFGDTLTGDAGANALWGQGGDDVLTGGGGGDTLKGGAGVDRFVYLAAGDSAGGLATQDKIGDFAAGDRIDVSAIDVNGAGPGNGSFTFITGAFTGAGGEVRVAAGLNGYVAVQGDIDGDTVADFTINALSDHTLTAGDFVL